MDVKTINDLLSRGEIEREDMWPHLREMEAKATQFRFEFGLDELPLEPGLIIIRGARQYGKSTWLEMNLKESIEKFGKGSAYFLNGDELTSNEDLVNALISLRGLYHPDAKIKRLFIDEITAIPEWEKGIKRIIDRGLYRDVLIVTTGSKATDLRHGSERLPGRKGRLNQSEFIFLPISYREFRYMTRRELGDKTWIAYLLTGGSPIACNDIYQFEHLPDYFIQLTRDWILGEIVSSGRNRLAFTQLIQTLLGYGGKPVGFAKLARESGMANNTVASGYIEQLSDLLSVLPSWPCDAIKKKLLFRKPCKFHFINLAAAVAFHPSSPRYVHEFEAMPTEVQGTFIEWFVAQEIWRRSVLAKTENPEKIGFWLTPEHEIDFITPQNELIEVKRGQAGPTDFAWFPKTFPKSRLTVICKTPFQTQRVEGVTLEQFLLSSPTTLHYEEES